MLFRQILSILTCGLIKFEVNKPNLLLEYIQTLPPGTVLPPLEEDIAPTESRKSTEHRHVSFAQQLPVYTHSTNSTNTTNIETRENRENTNTTSAARQRAQQSEESLTLTQELPPGLPRTSSRISRTSQARQQRSERIPNLCFDREHWGQAAPQPPTMKKSRSLKAK